MAKDNGKKDTDPLTTMGAVSAMNVNQERITDESLLDIYDFKQTTEYTTFRILPIKHIFSLYTHWIYLNVKKKMVRWKK